MSVYTGISGRSCEVLAIPVGDVLPCLWVSESLGQPKIDDINEMLLFANTYQEIVRFDISVQKVPGVDKLESLEL